jgi:PAS domain S-box-containing protein
VPASRIDLAALDVAAEDFLAAVLDTVAQPIWVVDPGDLIRFANPAAVAALGYERADELLGRRSHDTIHYAHPDGSPYPAAECPMLLPRSTGETVSCELDWFFRRDGTMFPVSYVSAPIEMPEGRGAVVAFTDIEERMNAERELREHDERLAGQQASLRRIATMVAGGAASAEVFAAIAEEVARVLDVRLVGLWRYEPDGTEAPVGWHPADVDPAAIAEMGARAPIVVDGRAWGVMAAGGRLPADIGERLGEFTDLVATAISSSTSRAELARLADEQAALRRVATLVAREASPDEVLAAIAKELGRLLDATATRLVRYDDDGTATIVASWGRLADSVPVGTRMALGGINVISLVARSGRPARIDDYSKATGPIAAYGRGLDARGAVGGPIAVGGRLWGAMIVSSRQNETLPAGTEAWIEQFAELAATAIANVQARTDLAASRARIAAAADEERRRVVRDLHDGAQQRLVHTVITLKFAEQALPDDGHPAPALLREALGHVQDAVAELRELAHGILPSVLAHGGLRAGVDALALRMPIPVETDVSVDRLPAAVEATAYFVTAEALTNVAKHARASSATVRAHVDAGTLRLEVQDDGIGGARSEGSGLLGLKDRLAVLHGRLVVEDRADRGTLVAAEIPLADALPAAGRP